MNIYDIAKMAEVSIATVSRVLNGSGKVSAATRDKILHIMDMYDYTPNAFARGLGLGSMRSVGVLCADTVDLYLGEAVFYIENNLRANDFNSLLCCTGYDINEKEKALKFMLSKKVDAIILAGSHYAEEDDSLNDYIRKAATSVPVFTLNAPIKGDNIYCTICDDYGVTYDLANRLINTGSKNIIFIKRHESDGTRRKIAAIKKACQEHGLSFSDKNVILCDRGISGVVTSLKKASESIPFDTVMCVDDLLAASTLKYAEDCGLSVPGDLRVSGYDYSILSLTTAPLLTTVDNKVSLMSRTVVDTLIHQQAGALVSNYVTISPDIIMGKST